jgi:alkanesulfonate monooxygenase SsuD/methylene tetrahydromethanopterin reductase-like flavin-dependent oxidoreductase (luciferase family)
MAALTSRIRVGCQVTAAPYRHPAVLANMVATVDHVSSGRLILGIGAAWNEMECNAYGMPLPPLKERFDRFDEGLEVITRLLSSTVANYSGEYFTLTDARCEPKPLQRPYPPITIGGNGPKRTLRAAARWASEWNGINLDAARFGELKEILRGHCADIGRDVAEITCSVTVRWDGSDYDALLASVTQWRDAGVDLAVIGLPTHAKPESLATIADAVGSLG